MRVFITNPKYGGELSKVLPAALGRGGASKPTTIGDMTILANGLM